MALPITIYGSHTCEDTALVRDRFLEFNIPFTEHDKEDSPRVVELLTEYGKGSPHTPTIVFGNDEQVLIEPGVQELDAAVRAAGYPLVAHKPMQFDPNVNDRPAPAFKLPSAKGGELALAQLRESPRSVLFLAHNHTCRACQGYAHQLAAMQSQRGVSAPRLVIVLQDDVERARKWATEFAPTIETLADGDGTVKRIYASHFGVRPEGALVLALDSSAVPRAGWSAPDAGGLVATDDIVNE